VTHQTACVQISKPRGNNIMWYDIMFQHVPP